MSPVTVHLLDTAPLPARAYWPAACHEMKPFGKPRAENLHVRFDERRRETERTRDTAPVLDSTGNRYIKGAVLRRLLTAGR